ncbi:MAG: DNA adenine methylase, partial [Lachnospiraceae bacterium]|nr:DNA adenine methylase [Lachnospiraceae bacterium]
MQYIKAPMNYIGNKYRIMGQIQKWFPRNVDLMVDIFCGGCDVTFNTKAREHIANDINFFVIDIYKEFQQLGIAQAIKQIDRTINEWKLTKENKEAYERFREYYNRTKNPIDLYVLMCFSFNYQFRFNTAHEYNNPFGKARSSFNDVMRENLMKLQG